MHDRLDDHVLLMTYADEPEANLLAARLREAGIGAEVVGGVTSTTLGPYAGHNSPVRVMVFADQHEAALRLLDGIGFQHHAEFPADMTPEDDLGPIRESAMATSATFGRYLVISSLATFVLLFAFGIYQYLTSLSSPTRYGDDSGELAIALISAIGISVIVLGVVGFCRLVSRLLKG